MEIEMGDIFSTVTAIILAIGGLIMALFNKRIDRIEDENDRLKELHAEHEKEFATYREFVARSYPTKEETKSRFDMLDTKLDRILEKLDKKADKT